ncbi:DUF2089 family protein [Olivibacter sitiensis]|uniref:DUF2089 family protein n=1 Tax=Olivibacter sitiensis TaxID=376470 RepID=UPI00047F53E7|nr:DUF2089 family protein [Olivibacter sitiensis]
MKAKLPLYCPSCHSALSASQLSCEQCHTQVSGHFPLPALLRLTEEEQHFVLQFLVNSGSLKEMASQMGKSYPTVRNKLDDVIAKVKSLTVETDE